MNKDPKKRLGYTNREEIYMHPYFRNLSWKKLENKLYHPHTLNVSLLNDELFGTVII